MAIRVFCLMLLGLTASFWSLTADMDMPTMGKLGMHLFYGGGCLFFLYGIVTGRAPG